MAFAVKASTKLLLLIPHLGGGGAERVTSLLAQYLDPNQFEIHLGLITHDAVGASHLPRWVVVHRLNANRVRFAVFKLLALVWRLRPHVVLGGMAHLNFLLLLLQLFFPRKTRVLIRQNTTASSAPGKATKFLYRSLYPLATGIVCQSEAMAADLCMNFAIPRKKLAVLANPIVQSNAGQIGRSTPGTESVWSLLCVARLSHEKGVDLLLQALATLRQTLPEVRLTVLGTGPESKKLAVLVDQLELQNHVLFPGHVDPGPYYAEATIFVCPSRYEGMPNSLLEAAASGLPIVATPSSLGVKGLLQGAPGAWMTAEVSAHSLTAALLEAVEQLRASPPEGRRFRHDFLAPFESARAIHAYEQVLRRVEAVGHF